MKQITMFIIILIFIPLFPSCATVGSQAFTMAFKTCAVGAFPSALKGLEEDAVHLLLDNGDLKTIGVKEGITLGLGTLNCIISGAVAALEVQAHEAATVHAAIDVRVPEAIKRGKAFLAKEK